MDAADAMKHAIHIPTLIGRKRDGEEIAASDLRALVEGFTAGDVADAQMAAFAMAVCLRGMTSAETAILTHAMIDSGDRFTWPSGHPPVVDKHSTGGIGDKVSLVLAPLVACTGCWIPMVSGRGLGITGGTLDKLEAIPGFRVHLDIKQAAAQVSRLGVVMMGQTDRFCPADKKFYALRDVTGTVPSVPLITASIMSKKLAESLDRLVLDVKYGSGTFMRGKKEAQELADSMSAVGKEMGVEVHVLLHPMNEPTGRAVGNALEVIEAVDTLDGRGPDDLVGLVVSLAAPITGRTQDELRAILASGAPKRKFEEIVEAQGGDPADLDKLASIYRAPVIREMPAPDTGTVAKVDAGMIGQAALQLGAGRSRASDAVDFRVGFDRIVKTGETVHQGQPLCRIHARTPIDFDFAEAMLGRAFRIER